MDGISRRELLTRSAVAGGVLWATPTLMSGTAWGASVSCDCDGVPVYTKIAGSSGSDAQTCGNQCLQPVGLATLSFNCLDEKGFVDIYDASTRTSDDFATVEFQSKSIALNRMSLKASETCYMVTCVEDFATVWRFGNSENDIPEPKHLGPIPDGPLPDTDTANGVPPIFKFEDGDGVVLGDSNTGVPAGTKVRKITWNSKGLPHKVNFIEFILCVENLSRIPCAVGDECVPKNPPAP